MQVAHMLRREYTGLEVLGSHYPVHPTKAAIAQVVGAGQMAGIALSLFGDRILPALGISEPIPMVANLQKNKYATCMLFWFLGGTLQQNLMKTSAFEVYFDGQLIFSKLRTGELPTRELLLGRIDAMLEAKAPRMTTPAQVAGI